MNIMIWILAGSALGWAAYTYMNLNEGRGMVVSAIIGGAGGLLGGKMVAPIFTAASTVPDAFSIPALFFAAAVAAAFVYLGSLVHERWGV